MQTKTIDLLTYAEKGIDFKTYYQDVLNVIENGDITDEYRSYYNMNSQRMERLQKRIQLCDIQKGRLETLNRNIELIIITEGWCGDAAQIIPVIEKLVEGSEFLDARIVYRDENPDLMDAYLTNGGMSIPIIVGMDSETGQDVFRWGPRPEFGNKLLKRFKDGELTKEEFQLDLQKSYNKDKGEAIIDELLLKLEL